MRTKENIIKLIRKPWTGQMTAYMLPHRHCWRSLHDALRLHDIVHRAMTWDYTPQGDAYWSTIYNNLQANDE